tara:strand:+ start:369 stop:791 length:423 start_codon:yes stop_codon:yes gene_type:complete
MLLSRVFPGLVAPAIRPTTSRFVSTTLPQSGRHFSNSKNASFLKNLKFGEPSFRSGAVLVTSGRHVLKSSAAPLIIAGFTAFAKPTVPLVDAQKVSATRDSLLETVPESAKGIVKTVRSEGVTAFFRKGSRIEVRANFLS